MRHLYVTTLLLTVFTLPIRTFGFQYKVINVQELKKKTQGPCTVLHFWAAWCEICIKELPVLLKYFETSKGFESVVVDLSADLAQEKFSKPWLKKMAPQSTTYRKGKTSDRALIQAVKSGWDEALPLSLLMVRGMVKANWEGAVEPSEIKTAVAKHCNVPPPSSK